jgi:DNA primase large subunit
MKSGWFLNYQPSSREVSLGLKAANMELRASLNCYFRKSPKVGFASIRYQAMPIGWISHAEYVCWKCRVA